MARYSHHKQFNGGLIKGIPFFASLTTDEAEAVESLVVIKLFSRDEVVLFEEDTSNYMYIIVSGKVRVVQVSSDGKERILAIHKRGDYFGELALIDGKTAPATVIAMEESEIGLLSKKDFDELVQKNDKIIINLLNSLCTSLRESWMMLKIMSFADAEERVRAVLKNMCRLYGVKDQRGVLVSLKLTHKDIANYASVSRETVTRLMSRFSKGGEIEILDKRYILIKPTFSKKTHLL
jgi:CRP/FNR family transcriptional regulator, cyclic AMP receptor protein